MDDLEENIFLIVLKDGFAENIHILFSNMVCILLNCSYGQFW
jgi:hypothetical protein